MWLSLLGLEKAICHEDRGPEVRVMWQKTASGFIQLKAVLNQKPARNFGHMSLSHKEADSASNMRRLGGKFFSRQ